MMSLSVRFYRLPIDDLYMSGRSTAEAIHSDLISFPYYPSVKKKSIERFLDSGRLRFLKSDSITAIDAVSLLN